MKRWLRGVVLLCVGAVLLSGCGTANLNEVKSVTIYQQGEAISVSADDPAFKEMAETAESALESISDVYKGETELSAFEKAEQAVVIELKEPQMMTVSSWDDDGEYLIRYVAIPLTGDEFEKSALVAAGGVDGMTLGEFKARKTHLKYLRKLVNRYVDGK